MSGRPLLAFMYHPRSFPALSIVEAARETCGLLWVVDSDHPDLGSNPRLLARFGEVVDTAGLDAQAVARLLETRGVGGILALADDLLVRTADIADCMGLPFHTPEVAATLTDKLRQRTALRAAGLPGPGIWAITGPHDSAALDIIDNEATFPAVLKPRVGEGSRDTVPIACMDELRRWLLELHDPARPCREFVLEEYIPDSDADLAGAGFANYVSVETVVSGATVSNLAITGRTRPAHPFRETGFFIPSALPADRVTQVLAVAAEAAHAVGVTDSCLHIEIKLTPTGPILIEVNGRIGGGIPELLEGASGLRLLEIAMRVALGERIEFATVPLCTRVGYLLYVQGPADGELLRGVDGLDTLRTLAGVDEIILNRRPGEPIGWRGGNHGHIFSVFGVVDNIAAVHEIDEATRSLVTIHAD